MLPSVVLVYAFIIKIKIIYAGLKRAINEREGSLEILFFDSFLFPIRRRMWLLGRVATKHVIISCLYVVMNSGPLRE